MGLSDGERLADMYWSAKHLYELGTQLQQTKSLLAEPLASLCKQVWAKLLGKNNNGGYWFIGGDLANPITDTTNAWAIAITSKYEGVRKNRQDTRIGLVRDTEDNFDPFNEFLCIKGLINKEDYNGELYKIVYDIYAWTENLVYALRRYSDDFLKNFSEFSDLLSEIQGVCFGLFTTTDLYAKAYLVNQILKDKFYANKTIKKLADKGTWYFSYRTIMEWPLDKIMRLHKELFMRDQTLHTLLKYSLLAMGDRFHYEHKFNELAQDLSQIRDGSINIDELRDIWKENCFNVHEVKGKENQDRYSQDKNEGALYIVHGFDKDDDFFEEPELKPKNPVKKKKPLKK